MVINHLSPVESNLRGARAATEGNGIFSLPNVVENISALKNGWGLAALVAPQCAGQPKLHYSDNFMTAHQPAEKPTRAVHCVREWPPAISHWAAESHLWGNEMTMKWMKNASGDIFLHFTHWGFLHSKNGTDKEQTNKPTKCACHTCRSLFQNSPGFGSMLIPSYVLSSNALEFFLSVGTDRGWSAAERGLVAACPFL